jgi:starch-binding outer membrane protein, SusD/RagB family
MKKFLKYFAAGCMVFSMTSCLDVEPQSEITDAGYWKEEGQFSSANTGLQAMFRDRTFNLYLRGGSFQKDAFLGNQ